MEELKLNYRDHIDHLKDKLDRSALREILLKRLSHILKEDNYKKGSIICGDGLDGSLLYVISPDFKAFGKPYDNFLEDGYISKFEYDLLIDEVLSKDTININREIIPSRSKIEMSEE